MTKQAELLLEQALALPPKERAKIAAQLLESMNGVPDEVAEEAWIAEIEGRAERARSGVSKGESREQVRERVKRALKRK